MKGFSKALLTASIQYCTKSLKHRILSITTALLLTLNCISIALIIHHTNDEITEIFNAQQAQLARTINQVILDFTQESDQTFTASVSPVPNFQHEEHDNSNNHDSSNKHDNQLGHYYEKKIAYQIWHKNGSLLLRSENAPLEPLGQTQTGFHKVNIKGEPWHVFGVYSDISKRWVYTAQSRETRDELVNYIVQDYILNLILINLMIVFITALGVIFGLKPLLAFSRALAIRGAENLQPIQIPVCEELEPIQQNVNLLLARIEKSLTQEKAFNADVSHELRTPLATIKIHGQNIQQQESLSTQSKKAVQWIIDATDQMTEICEQLLLLDRLESETDTMVSLNLHQLAKQVLVELPDTAHDTHAIELKGSATYIQGHAVLLRLLIRNLVENAVKYSPKGSNVTVSISSTEHQCTLEVQDQGPGMTAAQKSNALKRRYRVTDSQAYGSGLGLAIVQKIIQAHTAELCFLDNETQPGLRVQVIFGR